MAHWNNKWPVDQAELTDHLTAFYTASPTGRTRVTYFLRAAGGNVLFHGPDRNSFYDEFRDIFDDAGGIAHHVLTHAPETSGACRLLAERYGAKHWLSEIDQPYARREARGTEFSAPPEKGRWITGLKPVALPGHTPGFTGYLFTDGPRKWLFLGDFITQGAKNRGWRTATGAPLMKAAFASIDRIEKLKFDAVLPNLAHQDRLPPWDMTGNRKADFLDGARAFLDRKFRIAKP